MRQPVIAAAVVVLAVLAAPTAGLAESEFARSGFYVGGAGTYGINLLESAFDDVLDLSDVEVDNTWGGNVRLGYRATSWFAVEAEYEYLDNFEVSAEDVRLADLRAQTISANLRFIAPIKRFQPFLRLGAGATLFSLDNESVSGLEVDHSSFSGRIGIGFDIYATRNIVLALGADAVISTAEVEDPVFSGDTSSSLSYVALYAGFDYRF